MSNNSNDRAHAESNETPVRRSPLVTTAWALLIMATLYVCYFSHLGAIGLVGPDEPRYAWIARAMVETGDWITPRLYGQPWFEKPVLYYWGAALSFKWFGVSDAAARLPSAVAALFATMALGWLAWRIYGANTARWLLVLLPTCVGMIGFSHAATPDMLFSGMLTVAMVAAAALLQLFPPVSGESNNRHRLPTFVCAVIFGVFLGLAVLAKGPAALILCGGAVFLWAVFTRQWRQTLSLLHPAGVAAFLLTALPWYVLCARRNPDFFRIFIIEHNFKRFLTPEFRHIQPFWFYVPVILLALFPWMAFLIGVIKVLAQSWKLRGPQFSFDAYLLSWASFTIVFFTISKSKLPGYILPALPPLGLLVARSVSLRLTRTVRGERWLGITAGITLLALGIGASVAGRTALGTPYAFLTPSWMASETVVFAIVAIVCGFLKRGVASLVVTALSLILAVLGGVNSAAGRTLDQMVSARVISQTPLKITTDSWLDHAATYHLRRSFHYGLNYYMHREVPEWDAKATEPNWIFAESRDISALRQMGLACPTDIPIPPVIVCKTPALAASPGGDGNPQ